MDYAKTQLLKPNEEQQVTLSFSLYDFASYVLKSERDKYVTLPILLPSIGALP